MGKLQSEFGKSANTIMDNAATLKAINAKVASFDVPENYKGNPKEFERRMQESTQRLLGDKYMLSIQNQTGFNLAETLRAIPKNSTPASLNEEAATIENRVITAGEKPDPATRLRNATMDQQKFLERAADNIGTEKAMTGTVSAEGSIKDAARNSYAGGMTPADVVNYATLTKGVEIPADTVKTIAAIPAPEEKKPASAVTPSPKASAPTAAP